MDRWSECKPALPLYTPFCVESKRLFVNYAGKRRTTALITQLVSYSGSSLGSTKLGSRLRNEPLVCP